MSLQTINDAEMVLSELNSAQKVCQALMKTPHYAKMGEVGIFAIMQKAKSMGMSAIEALNGGMYFVQGKCEMPGQAMLSLIRSKGHSVTMDAKSNDRHVIMHGKRADNGDTWTVEFSIEDAKKAGIYKNVWEKYPKTMCTWRCVSMLGRFLFSDVIKGVYVQGEISDSVPLDQSVNYQPLIEDKQAVLTCTKSEAECLMDTISECSPEYQNKVTSFLKRHQIESIYDLPVDTYLKMRDAAGRAKNEFSEQLKVELDTQLSKSELVEAVSE